MQATMTSALNDKCIFSFYECKATVAEEQFLLCVCVGGWEVAFLRMRGILETIFQVV